MIQYTQGLILPKKKGTLTQINLMYGTTEHSAYISPNEVGKKFVSGSFVVKDTTVANGFFVKQASATDELDLLYMIVRKSPKDDVEFEYLADKSIVNARTIDNCSIVKVKGITFTNEAGDVLTELEKVMIDDTDATRSSLIPFVEAVDPAPANYAIARATEVATAGGQVIIFQSIQ